MEIKNKKTEAWGVWAGLFVIYIGINLIWQILSRVNINNKCAEN